MNKQLNHEKQVDRAIDLESRAFGIEKAMRRTETDLEKLESDFELAIRDAKNTESRLWQQVSDKLTAAQVAPLERYLELEATKKDIRAMSAYAGWILNKDLNPAGCLEVIKRYLKGRA